MKWLMLKIGEFVQHWRNFTGLPYKYYHIGRSRFAVDWAIVSLVVASWVIIWAIDAVLF